MRGQSSGDIYFLMFPFYSSLSPPPLHTVQTFFFFLKKKRKKLPDKIKSPRQSNQLKKKISFIFLVPVVKNKMKKNSIFQPLKIGTRTYIELTQYREITRYVLYYRLFQNIISESGWIFYCIVLYVRGKTCFTWPIGTHIHTDGRHSIHLHGYIVHTQHSLSCVCVAHRNNSCVLLSSKL